MHGRIGVRQEEMNLRNKQMTTLKYHNRIGETLHGILVIQKGN